MSPLDSESSADSESPAGSVNPVDSDTIWVRHNRIDLAIHHLTNGSDPTQRPLLLLHGLGERTPDEVPPNVRWPGPVYGLDFTGHGQSTIPVGGGYTSEILVGDVDASLEVLGEVTIWGADSGPISAFSLPQRDPSKSWEW